MLTPKLSWTSKLHCQSFGISCPRWLNADKLPATHPCRFCYAKTGNSRRVAVRKVLDDNAKWTHGVIQPIGVSYGRMVVLQKVERAAHNLASLIGKDRWFRWHHAGDVLNATHFALICRVCELTPDTSHWLPVTPESARAFCQHPIPENLTVRESSTELDSPATMPWGTTVYTQTPPKGHYVCPGDCTDCRVCWSRTVRVAYKWHGDAIVRREARACGLNV